MIKIIKKNKLLTILLLLTLITLITGLLLPSIINRKDTLKISNNIINMYKSIKNNTYYNHNIINLYSQELILTTIIWLSGISIIAIFIIVLLYLFKVLILGCEISFLFINLNKINILFIIIYLLPKVFSVITTFIISFYSIEYSIILFRLLFLKHNIPIKRITKTYSKLFLIVLFIIIIKVTIDIFLLPKILILL